MSFEIRNKLMQLVQNDGVSYKMAFEFVNDNADKLSVFTTAHQNQGVNQGGIENRTAAAVNVAKTRWEVMYPVDDTK